MHVGAIEAHGCGMCGAVSSGIEEYGKSDGMCRDALEIKKVCSHLLAPT